MKTLFEKFAIVRAPETEGEPPAPAAETPPAAEEAPANLLTSSQVEGEETPDEEAPAEQPVMLTADAIEVPEGMSVTDTQKESLLSIMNNAELTPAQRMNELLKLQSSVMEEQAAAWVARQEEAATALKADPVVGGKFLDNTLTAASNVLREFAPESLYAKIDAAGLGNDRDFAEFLVNIHKMTSEGKPVVGAPTSGATVSTADKLYPNQGNV